jgi:membrane protein DedA with SNARE-associated domain
VSPGEHRRRRLLRDGSALDRHAVQLGDWIERHTFARWAVIVGLLVVSLPPGIVLLAVPGLSERLGHYAYAGVFAVNLLANIPMVPVPGLSALGQAVILRQANARAFPSLVGVAGGLGMGLGETPVYYTGAGARAAHGTHVPGPAWFRRCAGWIVRLITHLMERWGMPTIFVLSAIPNPVFEIAGLSAGSTRMGFRRYLIAGVSGKIVRGLILVYLARFIPFV